MSRGATAATFLNRRDSWAGTKGRNGSSSSANVSPGILTAEGFRIRTAVERIWLMCHIPPPPPPPLSPSLSISLFLSPSFSLSLARALSLSLYLSLYLFLSLSLSLSLSVTVKARSWAGLPGKSLLNHVRCSFLGRKRTVDIPSVRLRSAPASVSRRMNILTRKSTPPQNRQRIVQYH